MHGILKEFAYGNVNPLARRVRSGSHMDPAMRAADANEKVLLENLRGEDKVSFQKYIDAQSEVNRLTAVEGLVVGYKPGLTTTAEAFVGGEMPVDGEFD